LLVEKHAAPVLHGVSGHQKDEEQHERWLPFPRNALYSGAQLSGCSGRTTPIAYFATHGLSDSVLNISGGRSLRDHFVSVNGVTPRCPPEPAVGSGAHICTKYAGGSPSYPVTWRAFDGDHNPNPHDSGQGTSWVPQQVWNFFSQF
jgi:hypothetical protein